AGVVGKSRRSHNAQKPTGQRGFTSSSHAISTWILANLVSLAASNAAGCMNALPSTRATSSCHGSQSSALGAQLYAEISPFLARCQPTFMRPNDAPDRPSATYPKGYPL